MTFINKQIDPKGCVPIALTNAKRWTGEFVHFPEVRSKCIPLGFNPKSGVMGGTKGDEMVDRMCRALGLKFTRIGVRSVSDIERLLDMGFGVVLSYAWFMRRMRPSRICGGHLIFIKGHEGSFLDALNVNGNGAEYKPKLDQYIKTFKYGSQVWLIER
jgi:hypothetical protein